MHEYFPLLFVGALIGTISAILIIAFACIKDKKEAIGFERNVPDREIIRRLAHYARPYIGEFAAVFVVMLLSIAYEISAPMIVGKLETMIKASFELPRLYSLLAVYVGLLAVSLVCTYAQAILIQRTGQKIVSALRQDTFEHIEKLSHDQLTKIPVGKLVTRVTNDTMAITRFFTNILVTLFKNVIIILGVLAAMLMLNYELTLMVLCFVPFVVLFTVIFRKFSRRSYRQIKNRTTDINTYLSENLSGIKITQIFNQEGRKMRDFTEKSVALRKAQIGQTFVFAFFRPSIYLLYVSCLLCLFYLGGKGYIGGTSFLGQVIESGTIVSFYMYVSRFFTPIQNLAEQFNMLQSAFASAEKIFTILDIEPEVVDEPGAVELTEVKGEIEFKDVWFAYVPEKWVLKGVSFRVGARQTVAFVGATGAGKTTILSLICRNYDIQRGQILIDGVDIRRYTISSLRRHFGQMLQDVFLFSGTVRSNIVLREESFTDEQINEACRYVGADSFISKLDKGLDDTVIERGSNFSAGQRQLLSFARTVIHRPEVMILDEATANIDTETEQLIQSSLEKMRTIGTMLIVAHRLSTIQHADNIILLSHGEIMEQGDHQTLLAKKGMYYHLYTLQYSKQQLLANG